MARERIPPPPDPRAAGVLALRQFMPLPGDDAEARLERKLLRRIDRGREKCSSD
jgi:hypothetical protein